jgi:two-component system sensor histidine kinase KdpD
VPARRQWAGAWLGLVGIPAVTAALAAAREHLSLATPVLLVLSVVVTVALVGGLRPAAPAALAGALCLNFFFTEPLHELTVERPQDLLVLVVYLAVAVAVSGVVDLAARRTAEAARAQAEAEALSSVAGATLAEQETLPAVLERVREVFSAHRVELVDGLGVVLAGVGEAATGDHEQRLPAGRAQLVVAGSQLFAEDRRVLAAFAEAAGTALEGRRLAEQAEAAAAVDRLRTALLAGVGHDLRTPLAGVKAAVSSLRAQDVTWSEEESAELLATIEESADRLEGLVANLLDASRLQAGALSVTVERVGLDEVAAAAVAGLPGRERVRLDVAESLPPVLADAGLLERVVANLVENALRHDPGTVIVEASPGRLSVVDHGPGIANPVAAFAPFQRLGDRSGGGVGLGLAVAKGFVEAMGGAIEPSTTAGGGLTMTVVLPR